MILNMACFYLVLGACGILVHPLRKRPQHSVLNYVSRLLFAAGWVLLPFGALADLGLQFPNVPMPVISLICFTMFIVVLQRGSLHADQAE